MSSNLSRASSEYYCAYVQAFEQYRDFARAGQGYISQALADGGLVPHAVTARAKTPASLLRKLRHKSYGDPASQITDIVGIRVITSYRDEVDRGVEILHHRITVDDGNSVDKRRQLDLREFGYRSVHLTGRLADIGVQIPEDVGEIPFEVQIRSILEHAWAENEHEVVYKSGIAFPKETLRGFGAVAGALELLDGEFERFRFTVMAEIDRRVAQLKDDPAAWTVPCDAAAFIAAMECLAPDNPGWRTGEGTLPANAAALALEALVAAGLTTPQAIRLAFDTDAFKAALISFAALTGVTDEEVSHLAICGLMAATQPGFAVADFPDLFNDQLLVQALELPGGLTDEPS